MARLEDCGTRKDETQFTILSRQSLRIIRNVHHSRSFLFFAKDGEREVDDVKKIFDLLKGWIEEQKEELSEAR